MKNEKQKAPLIDRYHFVLVMFREFRWIHISLGFIGNLSFFVGSIFFLWEHTQWLGTWLFIIGAFGMLIGSFGRLMVTWEEYMKKRVEEKA